MAEKNVIGLAMDLDVSSLRQGLEETSRRIKDANLDFQVIASSLDDWTKSSEGLSAKLKQLNTILTEEQRALAGMQAESTRLLDVHKQLEQQSSSLKSQIDALNKEYQESVNATGENSEASLKLKKQLDGLNKEYDDTTKKLINNESASEKLQNTIKKKQITINNTQKSIGKYSDKLKEAEKNNDGLTDGVKGGTKAIDDQGKEADDTANSLDKLKSVGGTVAKGVAGIGAAVVGAAAGFLALGESTRETRRLLGNLETAFKTAGMSADDASTTFETLYGVVGDEGQAQEASLHIAALAQNQEDLAKWTDIATGVYATFGKTLPIENITEAANETSKTGKITGGLADALNWAGVNEEKFQASLDKCTSEQERQALITETLNGLYAEAGKNYKEVNKDVIEAQQAQAELTNTIAEFGAIAEPIMTRFKQALNGLLETLLPIAKVFGEGITGIMDGVDGASEKVGESISTLISTALTKITEFAPQILQVILDLIPMLITTILNALPSILDTLINLVNQIILALSEMLPQILTAVMDLLPKLITQLIDSLPMILESILTLVQGVIDALPTIITALIDALPSVIDSIINYIITAIPMLIEAAIQLFNSLIEALPVVIEALIENLPKVINTIIDGLLTALPMILEAAITLLMAIIDALPTIINLLIREIPRITNTIINTLLSRMGELVAGAIQLFLGILDAIPVIIAELVKNLPEIITTIVEALGDGVKNVFDVGVNLIKGVWEGIKSMGTWLWDKIAGFGGDIVDWFAEAFNINSPSKLMEDMIGKNIGLGVGEGILGSTKQVLKDIDKFNNAVVSGLELNKNIDLGSASGVVSGSKNITLIQNITSTKEPTIRELSRYTNNLLDLDKLKGYV